LYGDGGGTSTKHEGEAAFTPRQPDEAQSLQARIEELERFCGQPALENSTLKKAAPCSANKSRSDIALITRGLQQHPQLSVSGLCNLLGSIAPGTMLN